MSYGLSPDRLPKCPKTLQVLTYLISCRNRFVSKDELMSELWPDVRVTGASVTQCISELRGVLENSAREPRNIETRVKSGYRFVATLYHKPTEVMEPLPPPPEMKAKTERAPLRRNRRALLLLGAVLVLLMAAGGAVLLNRIDAPKVIPVVVSSVTTGATDESASLLAAALSFKVPPAPLTGSDSTTEDFQGHRSTQHRIPCLVDRRMTSYGCQSFDDISVELVAGAEEVLVLRRDEVRLFHESSRPQRVVRRRGSFRDMTKKT